MSVPERMQTLVKLESAIREARNASEAGDLIRIIGAMNETETLAHNLRALATTELTDKALAVGLTV